MTRIKTTTWVGAPPPEVIMANTLFDLQKNWGYMGSIQIIDGQISTRPYDQDVGWVISEIKDDCLLDNRERYSLRSIL